MGRKECVRKNGEKGGHLSLNVIGMELMGNLS